MNYEMISITSLYTNCWKIKKWKFTEIIKIIKIFANMFEYILHIYIYKYTYKKNLNANLNAKFKSTT